MTTESYATLDALTERLGQTAPGDADILQQALDWATSWIGGYCHRTFSLFADTRMYTRDALDPDDSRLLIVDEDLLSITTLLNGDGSEIDADDFVLEPRNRRPYWMIRLLSSASWTWNTDGWVTVGGDWGYSVDPDPLIVGACLSLAEYHYRSRRLAEVVTLTSATTGGPPTPKQYAFPDHVYKDLEPRVRLAR